MGRIKPQALLLQSKKKKGPRRCSILTIALILTAVVLVFFVSISYRSKFQSIGSSSQVQREFSEVDPKKVQPTKYAVISTSKGSITVELFREGSPEVVDKFIQSCLKGRFKGMPFSLVIKNFMIQSSADRPESTEDWTSRGKHNHQVDTSLNHEAFMLGTSKKKDGGSFDLIITTAPLPDLNEKINVFGRVVKGEDVVQEIEEADTDEHFQPKTPIRIIDTTLKLQL